MNKYLISISSKKEETDLIDAHLSVEYRGFL